MKLAKRIIIGLVVLMVLAWVGMYIAVKVALPPAKIMDLVSVQGSKTLGRGVAVGGASISVFPTIKIVIKDVELANAAKFSEDPMFSLKRVVLSLDFMSLMRMSPVIKEIRLEEPDILYEVDKKGRTNLDGLGGAPKPDEEEEPEEKPAEPLKIPAALSLKSFVIDNARVRYRDLKTGTILTLGSINQKASVEVDKNLEAIKTKGELLISSLSVSDKKSGVRKGGVKVSFGHDLEVNLTKQLLTINGMQFGLQDILIEMMGSVKDFQTPSPGVDIKLSSNEIKMASLLKEVPPNLSPEIPKLSAKGFAKLNASVIGVVDTAALPKVNATLSLNNMGFGHKELPAGINDMNGKIHITENSVEIKDFGFQMDQHPVSVAMLVTDLMGVPILEGLNIDSKLDLGPLTELADKFVGLPEGFSCSGKIVSNITASGKLDPENPMGIQAKGQVTLNNIALKTAELPERVRMNGMVNIDNQQITEKLDVKIGKSDVKVDVKVDNYLAMAMPGLAKGNTTKIKIDVLSQMLDLDQLLPTPSGEEEKADEETEPMTAYPSLPPVDLEMGVRLNKTKLMDLEMTNYVQMTTIKNNVVTTNLAGNLYTGSFSQKINVDLNDTSEAKVAMKLNVNKVEADDFISRLNNRIPGDNPIIKSLTETDHTIFGKFSMDMDVKTNGLPQHFADNLDGGIMVAILKGKLVGVNMVKGLNSAIAQVQEKVKIGKKIDLGDFTFDRMDIDLEARNGKLIIKDCKLKNSPAGMLNLTGRVGFDNKIELTLENHMSKPLSKLLLGGQKKLQGAASGAASKIPGAGKAAGAVAGSFALIPQDNMGRAIAYYAADGTLGDPKFSVDFKRMKEEASGGARDAAKDLLDQKKKELEAKARAEMEKAKARVEEEKKKVEKKIADEKKKVEDKIAAEKKKAEEKIAKEKQEAERKKREAEQKARQEAEKKKEEAKKKAKDKAKKSLKGLGL